MLFVEGLHILHISAPVATQALKVVRLGWRGLIGREASHAMAARKLRGRVMCVWLAFPGDDDDGGGVDELRDP